MEHEGLVRALQFFADKQVQIGTVVTDRHKQISKYLREVHPDIEHRYDVWHISKGMYSQMILLQLNDWIYSC